ncbi:unnamed protein product [Coccothraustes coccothraustes]
MTQVGARRVPEKAVSRRASPITVAAPPAPGSDPARDPPPLRRSQLAASPGAVFCMGRAYWPRPARAGQAYVLEAAIGQVARELRAHGGDGVGRCDPHLGNNAGMAAAWEERESWHSPTLDKGRQSTDGSQEHLPMQGRWRRTKLQIKIPFRKCPGQ